jgi:branched-subunit amino acid aminotransferase/4-amino-4-deoxychorismate lyase
VAAELTRGGFQLLLLTLHAQRLQELCACLGGEMAELDHWSRARAQCAEVVDLEACRDHAEPRVLPGEETH